MYEWNATPRDEIADLLDGAAALAARAAQLRRAGRIDQAAISEFALVEQLRTIRHERARAERAAVPT